VAINRDPAEWFERPERWNDVVYGILERKDGWVVLKKEWAYIPPKVSEIAQVDSRKAAIGIIKLLVEK
jgi:hypothetical protein